MSISNKVETVVRELVKLCEEAHINESAENLIRVLIAYLRGKDDKEEDDYAINAVVAKLILNAIPYLKANEFLLYKEEFQVLCKCIAFDGKEEEQYIEEKRNEVLI